MTVDLFDRVIGGRRCRAVASVRSDGDIHPSRVDPTQLTARQRQISGSSWTMVDHVHGCAVHRCDAADVWPVAARADVVADERGAGRHLAVWAADCAPLALFGSHGTVAVAHAGWRGLAAGVIDAAVGAVCAHGESVAAVVVGPMIHPCCYEFSPSDIDDVARGVHAAPGQLSGETAAGSLALDAPAAVRAGLAVHGLSPDVLGGCTGCSTRWFSHRVRSEPGRHALVAWSVPVAE